MRPHPFHLALMISSGAVAIVNLLFSGVVLTGSIGNIVGLVMAASAVSLFAGWVFGNRPVTEWALLLAAGAWTSRATFALLTTDHDTVFTTTISMAWAIGAGGSWWLWRQDPHSE